MSFLLLVTFILIGSTTSTFTASASAHLDPFSDAFINSINSRQNLWRAGRNFDPNRPLIYFKRLMGSLNDIGLEYLPQKVYENVGRLPRNFDAREHWKNCKSLRDIRDQGSCGSCWAVATVSAMTDRFCINSNGTNNFYFSEDDVLSCCTYCGPGCDGGIVSKAWAYTQTEGTVSGGPYQSERGCKPYEIPPCEHSTAGNRPQCGHVKKPSCRQVCRKAYQKKYLEDKKKVGIVYSLKNHKTMKRDILKYGPITTSIKVYTDFILYQDGIYKHVAGTYIGDHAIKILGWGVQNKTKYWLAANSWNIDWGENGFFKILRGENHCNVESSAIAGKMVL